MRSSQIFRSHCVFLPLSLTDTFFAKVLVNSCSIFPSKLLYNCYKINCVIFAYCSYLINIYDTCSVQKVHFYGIFNGFHNNNYICAFHQDVRNKRIKILNNTYCKSKLSRWYSELHPRIKTIKLQRIFLSFYVEF